MFPNVGENSIQPANVSYVSYLNQAVNLILDWPFSFKTSANVTASMIEISTTNGSINVVLPYANQCSVGQMMIIRNVGSHSFVVRNALNELIVIVEPQPSDPDQNVGNTKYIYLVDNTTVGGVWHYINYGTGTSSVIAGDLAGPGLQAENDKLETTKLTFPLSTPYTITDADRAKVYECDAAITITLPATAPDNGFYVDIVNVSTSNTLVTVNPNGNDINGSSSNRVLTPGQAITLISNGSDWIGQGIQSSPPVPLPISLGGTNATDSDTAFKNLSGMTQPGDLAIGGLSGLPDVIPRGEQGTTLLSRTSNIGWGGVAISQVVYGSSNALASITSSSPLTFISKEIERSNVQNKVFVMFDVYVILVSILENVEIPNVSYTLFREQDSIKTPIYIGQPPTSGIAATGNVSTYPILNGEYYTRISGQYLDSPSTTSNTEITYGVDFQIVSLTTGQAVLLNGSPEGYYTGASSMTLIELGGPNVILQ